jgi:hypothetical protein
MNLFARKTIAELQVQEVSGELRRVLGLLDLTGLGIGAIIGAGDNGAPVGAVGGGTAAREVAKLHGERARPRRVAHSRGDHAHPAEPIDRRLSPEERQDVILLTCTGTGLPPLVPGWKRHCLTALIASSSRTECHD